MVILFLLHFLYTNATFFTSGIANFLVEHVAPLFVALSDDPAKRGAQLAQLQVWVGPIIASVLFLLALYFLGLLSIFTIGRRILNAAEHFLENLPLIKGVYGTVKQVIAVFRQGGGGSGFQRVVLVEFPRLGTWTIAFVTRTVTDRTNNVTYVCCFIPMTPNPTSGFFQLFREGEVRDTDWSVDQGLKILLSGGLLAPADLNFPAATQTGATPADVVPPPVFAKPGE